MTQAFNLSQFANKVNTSGQADLTTAVTGTLPVANGGTGSTSTNYCNLASNVTGTLPVANGGTGASTLTANNVLLGNGTSALQTVAPSTSGNVLTSNGTSWVSSAPSGGGFTLLGTLTTTSGNSQGLTGLNLTSYKQLYIIALNVSLATSTTGLVYFSSDNSQTYIAMQTMVSTRVYVLNTVIDLATGFYNNTMAAEPTAFFSQSLGASYLGKLNITNSSTSFYARASSTNTFDSGSIQVYGVK